MFSSDQLNSIDCEGKVAEVAYKSETRDQAFFKDHFEELSHHCLVNVEAEDLKRVEALRNPRNQLNKENRKAEDRV